MPEQNEDNTPIETLPENVNEPSTLSKISLYNQRAASATPRKPTPTPIKKGTAPKNNTIEPKIDEEQKQNVNDLVSNAIENTDDFFNSFQITGGLLIAFVILIFLIWVLIPTKSGYTRLQLLWFTITGQTKLITDNNPKPNTDTTNVTSNEPTTITLSTPVVTTETNVNGNAPSQTIVPFDLSALDIYGY